eukprot:655893-Pyramimonas_sp.AAC.1
MKKCISGCVPWSDSSRIKDLGDPKIQHNRYKGHRRCVVLPYSAHNSAREHIPRSGTNHARRAGVYLERRRKTLPKWPSWASCCSTDHAVHARACAG